MLRADELKRAIENAIPGSLVQVQDLTGTGDHFQALVVSDHFIGKPLLQQHQIVYGALGEQMGGDLHALGLKTFTPEAWRRSQPNLS